MQNLITSSTWFSLEQWGTIYKDHTDKPLADLHLDCHKIKKLTHNRVVVVEYTTEWALHQTASTLIKHTICIAIQPKQKQSWRGSGCHSTQPPRPTLTFFCCVFARWVLLPGASMVTYVTPSLFMLAVSSLPTVSFFILIFSELCITGNSSCIIGRPSSLIRVIWVSKVVILKSV